MLPRRSSNTVRRHTSCAVCFACECLSIVWRRHNGVDARQVGERDHRHLHRKCSALCTSISHIALGTTTTTTTTVGHVQVAATALGADDGLEARHDVLLSRRWPLQQHRCASSTRLSRSLLLSQRTTHALNVHNNNNNENSNSGDERERDVQLHDAAQRPVARLLLRIHRYPA